ncbi:MAG: phosphatase PAP2 family protein [Candidatus Aenigmarchaeota archaeon]|nr:phosphatase PAP2 family protein [Candidatus Aenigmarchaeota archaeon]
MDPWFFVTVLGDGWVWAIALILFVVFYLIVRKRLETGKRGKLKKFLILAVISMTITVILVFGLKMLFNTERPCIPCLGDMENCNPYCDTDGSFPSGHAAISFTGFGSLYMIFRRKWIWIFPVMVSISRLFLGVHAPLDVATGAVLGLVVTWCIYKLNKR